MKYIGQMHGRNSVTDETYRAIEIESEMSLRDYFAGQVIIGLLCMKSEPLKSEREVLITSLPAFADLCYMYADAMLEVRQDRNMGADFNPDTQYNQTGFDAISAEPIIEKLPAKPDPHPFFEVCLSCSQSRLPHGMGTWPQLDHSWTASALCGECGELANHPYHNFASIAEKKEKQPECYLCGQPPSAPVHDPRHGSHLFAGPHAFLESCAKCKDRGDAPHHQIVNYQNRVLTDSRNFCGFQHSGTCFICHFPRDYSIHD